MAHVPLAKISFSCRLMLACALIMNKQLEGVGKALYKLKNIKQVLAKIMYQTLMHSQTSQSTSTRWLEPQPRASQVREVMNVDSQTKDRTFALCGFRVHFWNPFFFFPPFNPRQKLGKCLLMNHLPVALAIPHQQKNYVRPQSWLACTQRKHAIPKSMWCLNWLSAPASSRPLKQS